MILPLALLALATLPIAPGGIREDEAHRLDRLQTRLLNERAAARLRGGQARPPADLRAREERAMARWRADTPCIASGCVSVTVPARAR